MHVDTLLPRIAEHLDLTIIRPLAGGEFGATLVAGADGRELVLKALPSESWAATFARGTAMAERMRARGYPAPEYVGTGAALGATWSLQERLPGETPDVMRESHMRRLLQLVESHAGAAGTSGNWMEHRLARIRDSLNTVRQHDATRQVAAELAAVIDGSDAIELLDDGVVHGDFHHRNFLAIGDEVTGVFDWEFARAGDWRFDLVTLAFWSAILPGQIPPDVARLAIDRARHACPTDVFAYLTADRAITQLDFDVRVHPERLPEILPALETVIAPWWRGTP